jgi:hypothetical protein
LTGAALALEGDGQCRMTRPKMMSEERYNKTLAAGIKAGRPAHCFEYLSRRTAPKRTSMLKKWPAAPPAFIVAGLTFSAIPHAEELFQKLNSQQIRAKFVGMELTDESHWGDVFGRDGTLHLYSMGHKSVGKWRIVKDQLCIDRGNEPGGGCYEVWIAGKKVELRSQFPPLEGVLQKPTDR